MKRIFCLLLLVFCCLSVTVVFAEEHRQNAGAAEHEESIWLTVGKWINFFALVGILYLFLARSLRVQDKFKAEAEEIRKAVESARQAKEEAEKKLQELDQRLAQMADEVSRVKEEAAREAEEEKKRILDSAQKEAERIVEMANREIDAEVRAAKQELQKQVADLAVSKGRKIIQTEINDQDHVRLVDRYIDDFGK
jgi:F-type H+-transporting ATPase subunit b